VKTHCNGRHKRAVQKPKLEWASLPGTAKTLVIPNRAKSPVRNLLFACAATNLCHSTRQQVPRPPFGALRNDKILKMGL
jgi:hypothetical protein